MLKRVLNFIFSYKVEYVLAILAKVTICILGLKLTIKIKDPIYNAKLCNKAGKKTILFFRGDGIGDYLFSRPYIKAVKTSEKYKKYKLVFMGTPPMIELAKRYDKEYINAYVTITKDNPREKAEFLKKVKKMSFNVIINPTDSKINYYLEEIVRTIKADEKICHFGFFANNDLIEHREKVEAVLKTYTKVVDTGSDVMYVWDRAKLFFEKLLGEKLPVPQKISTISDVDFKSDFVTVSPFARSPHRTYSAENFAKLINYINNELKMPVVMLGNKKEYEQSLDIVSKCNNPDMIVNKVGKLTISESMFYIRASKLLVANETGTVHIAQDYGIKTVCISNGSYMNTFQPYRGNDSVVNYVYPDDVEKYISSDGAMGHIIYNDINEINPQKVIDCINQTIGKMAVV